VYMRVTPQRAEELKAEAQRNGRSVSEEAELRIEVFGRWEAEKQELLAQMYDHQTQIGKLQQQLRTLKEKSAPEKANAATDERIAKIVATAVAQVTAANDKGHADRVAALEQALKGKKK
jgi:hypothetical protein